MSEHLSLMEESKTWFSDLAWVASDEMRALDRLDGAVKDAVKETGYPATEALKLQRCVGAPEAVKMIWSEYHIEMRQAHGR